MLITCPECNQQISDKATACPHCGMPMTKTNTRRNQSRRMRLPNGFGRITELKGQNLRKPYRAMVTVGTDRNGRPIGKLLKPEAYFSTYNEAYTALLEYNRNPFDLDRDMTMNELFERWINEHSKTVSYDTIYRHQRFWERLEGLHHMKVSEVRIRHLRLALDGITPNTRVVKTKEMLNLMMDYAVSYELTDHNYARDFTVDKKILKDISKNEKHHESFTEEDIEKIWTLEGFEKADAILIAIYTGFRPSELCELKLENINLEKGYMIGGCKTDAGTDRIVPIHPNIEHLLKKYKSQMELRGYDRLLYRCSYPSYRNHFFEVLNIAGIDASKHKPHDTRKTFITLSKKYSVDEYAIKRIVGHTINDITEEVYTDRSIDWLIEEISKIPARNIISTD